MNVNLMMVSMNVIRKSHVHVINIVKLVPVQMKINVLLVTLKTIILDLIKMLLLQLVSQNQANSDQNHVKKVMVMKIVKHYYVMKFV